MKLAGAVAVVTGGASGIGLGIGRALARRGAKVVLADIEAERAGEAARALAAEGLDAVGLQLDVIDEDSWRTLADRAQAQWGEPVSLLFNNAGVGAAGTVHGVSRQTWDWVFKVNVEGVYLGVRTFAPRMLESGLPSRIVNTASEHALGLPPSQRGGISAAYTAAKHAVLGYSLCMRRDFEGTNLSAGVVCPGRVSTDIRGSFRNRHPAFGGPRELPPAPPPAEGYIDADLSGERIARQVEDDAFFIFTNGPDEAQVLGAYIEEASAAMAAFRERFGV